MKVTQQKLKAGGLTKTNVLELVDKVVNVIRNCNVTLRWLMLHTASTYSGKLLFLFLKFMY